MFKKLKIGFKQLQAVFGAYQHRYHSSQDSKEKMNAAWVMHFLCRAHPCGKIRVDSDNNITNLAVHTCNRPQSRRQSEDLWWFNACPCCAFGIPEAGLPLDWTPSAKKLLACPVGVPCQHDPSNCDRVKFFVWMAGDEILEAVKFIPDRMKALSARPPNMDWCQLPVVLAARAEGWVYTDPYSNPGKGAGRGGRPGEGRGKGR